MDKHSDREKTEKSTDRDLLDPAFEDRSGVGVVSNHFLHVCVLVPQLIYTGEEGGGSLVHVTRVIDVLLLHLHLRVSEGFTSQDITEQREKDKMCVKESKTRSVKET